MIKKFLLYLLPVLIYMSFIFYLSSQSRVPVSIGFDTNGLILHIIEYFVLGFLVYRFLGNFCTKKSAYFIFFISLLISILYGISDEIHQSFVPNRVFSLIDLGADFLGSFIGIILYLAIQSKRKKYSIHQKPLL